MRLFLVSPYHGGSHAAWAEGYQRHSGHEVHLLTMEARFWKWRMFGSSISLAREAIDLASEVGKPDVVMATDMLDLPGFLGRTRGALGSPRVVLYMHENQMTYPLAHGAAEDLTYAFMNWQSMELADEVWWNSAFHRDRVLAAIPQLLGRFPDHRHAEYLDDVVDRMKVMPVGVEMSDIRTGPKTDPPLVVWNHRWEYDKGPEDAFAALRSVVDLPWRVALCGTNFRNIPEEFEQFRADHPDRVVQFGHAPRDRYTDLLGEATVALSTARQEFFGISMVEAAAAGALPLLPRRLSYPEVFPESVHDAVLYDSGEDLTTRLRAALAVPGEAREQGVEVAALVRRYGWDTMAPKYDQAVSPPRPARP